MLVLKVGREGGGGGAGRGGVEEEDGDGMQRTKRLCPLCQTTATKESRAYVRTTTTKTQTLLHAVTHHFI